MMHTLSPEVARTIKQIEITTRRMLNGALVGDSRSAVKGTGLEFDQIRDYQQGDDVRFIDWRATARADKFLVKQYIEERNRTVIIAVDCSGSSFYGSGEAVRYEQMARVASVLALAADYGKDQTALILFTDEVEVFVPAGKGYSHVRTLMEMLFTYEPKRKKTSLKKVFDRIAQMKRSDAVVFLISDFIDDAYDTELAVLARRHDIVAINCRDIRESNFPSCGILKVEDAETGNECFFDTRGKGASSVSLFLVERDQDLKKLFKKMRIDFLELSLEKDFWGSLIIFFRRRMSY